MYILICKSTTSELRKSISTSLVNQQLTWGGAVSTGYDAGFGKHGDEQTAGDKFLNGGNGVLNAGLRMGGSAAAIYNLATGTVKNTVNENALSFKVLA